MSPAASRKVFPSSVLASYGSKQQHQSTNSRSNSDNRMMAPESGGGEEAVVLTIWKKSLLMSCDGFTVYNGKGNLLYRVDNYVDSNRREIVLMDASGKPLLTMRKKRLTLSDCWMIYNGDKSVNHKFCVRKNFSLFNSKTLAQVTKTSSSLLKKTVVTVYEIEGSYAKRSVLVYDNCRRCVAEIRRKEAKGGISLGGDVFSLIVYQSCIDTAMAMGFVVLLEQMFGSSSSSLYSSHY